MLAYIKQTPNGAYEIKATNSKLVTRFFIGGDKDRLILKVYKWLSKS